MSTTVDVPTPTGPAPDAPAPAGGRAEELRALVVWLVTRAGIAVLALGGARLLGGVNADAVEPFLQRWDRWDAIRFRKIAEFGYAGYPTSYPDKGMEAFFPGEPLLLRAVHTVVPSYTAAGLLISLVTGAVAAVYLARLAAEDGVEGSRAVLYWVLSPYAVFLAAGYSEPLFLALALPGWLMARRGRWVAAGLLVAAATTVRVSGVFLALGLVVQYLVAHRGRVRADALALLAPFAAVAAFFAYLHALTGDWLAWQHAQAAEWSRRFTNPITAYQTTLGAARNGQQGAEYAWSWYAEIGAVGVGLVLVAVLLRRRRWGEATYVGLSLAALATSTYYLSIARATLLWFPMFVLLAAAARRRPWVHTAYLAVSAPLLALLVLTFTSGRWVG